MPDGSYSFSDIQDYFEYAIKKHKILTAILPIHVYINRINKRLVFKIKDGYKLELQTTETMKLFGSTIKLVGKAKNRENLVDNQYQQKSEVLLLRLINLMPIC